MSDADLDLSAHYSVAGYSAGIAFYLLGYELVRDEDFEWSGLEEENRDRVRAVMVRRDSDVRERAPIAAPVLFCTVEERSTK